MLITIRYKFIFFIFVVAFLLRLGFVVFYPQGKMLSQEPLCADGLVFEKYALNLLNFGPFGSLELSWQNRFLHLASPFYPLYYIFLSIIYFIFGHNLVVVRIIQVIISALSCIFVYFIAKEIFDDESIAKISAVIMVFYYPLINAAGYIVTETLFVFILTLSILLLIKSIKYHISASYLLSGLCWGLTVSCRSVIWGFIPILIIYLCYTLWRQKVDFIKYFFLFVCGILLIIIPLSLRNYKAYGIFTPVSRGGYFLYVGNNPLATGGTGGWITYENDMRVEKDIYEQSDRLSFLELDKLLRKRALEFIMNNPKKFMILAIKKFINMWRPFYSTARPITKIIFTLSDLLFIYPFSIVGMILCRKKKDFLLFYLLIGYYFFIHLIIYSMIRFRLPIMPFLIIFTACALKELKEKMYFTKKKT